MTGDRLSASIEATSLIRRAQAAGDFGAILRKGDAERGAILIVVRRRGSLAGCLERTLSPEGLYRWEGVGPGASDGDGELEEFLKKRVRFDEDLWLIELDIAQAERFIAETTSSG